MEVMESCEYHYCKVRDLGQKVGEPLSLKDMSCTAWNPLEYI